MTVPAFKMLTVWQLVLYIYSLSVLPTEDKNQTIGKKNAKALTLTRGNYCKPQR